MRGSGVRAAIGAWALVAVLSSSACAERILIPMDLTQTNHLKAYGVAFWVLERDLPVEWLLNYRGGSFLVDEHHLIAREAQIRGVSTEVVSEASAALIYAEVDAANMEVVQLEKAPRIAVYTPPNTQPWDDAVTMALEYAQIDYEKLWDEEVPFLHGGTPRAKREAMIERFQNGADAPPFFVLSLKAGGTGLNLTRATRVFHYDRWWNPAVENQATDRVFRIGQDRNVQVYKALCSGTVEEKVDAIVERKRALAERVVGGGEAWLTELSTAELKELFTLDKEIS